MSKKNYSDLSKEELLEIIDKLESKKKYGLVWDEEKIPEKVVTDCQKQLPVLKEVKNKEIKNNASDPIHILIEGDNYHALSVLNYTHKEKIDVIYIDPPYNTGNKDFLYNDSFVEKEDTYRHSKWCSFMNKRLSLAKDLLKPQGVIFISINEDEFCQLKLICDYIFSPENYLTTFTIKVRHEDRILKGDKDYHEVVEYLLLYRKSNSFVTIKRERDNTSIKDYVYKIIEKTDSPETIVFGNKTVQVYKPGEYEIIKDAPNESNLKKINIRGTIKEGNSSGRFYMKHLEPRKEKLSFLYKVPGIGDDDLEYRYFLSPTSLKKVNGDYFQGIPKNREDIKYIPYPNFIDFEEDFNNVGYEGGVDFRNGKKPLNFIKTIFELCGLDKNKKGIILDFFAGSGSTAEALLKLNKLDNGARQFILCTNNENKICEQKTLIRINNIMNGYVFNGKEREVLFEKNITSKNIKRIDSILTEIYEIEEENKNDYDELKLDFRNNNLRLLGIKNIEERKKGLNGNLKYFKTSFVRNSLNKDQVKIDITKNCTEMLCIKEGIYNLYKESDDWKIFEQSGKYLAVYYEFENDSIDRLKEEMNALKGKKILYCFTIDPFGLVKERFSDWKNIRLEPIPQKILDVYKRLFKDK